MTIELLVRAIPIVFSKKTAESSLWARERAHNLRYDAVFDTVPRTNSMVSIS